MDKLPMEGCKVVGGLFQAVLLYSSPTKGVLTDILGQFARNRINLNLLTARQTDDLLELAFLVSSEDGERARALIQSDPHPMRHAGFRASVDILNIFPHKAELRAVGLGLVAYARKGIPLYGFCSSLSTLTFVTDCNQTEKALSALGACLICQRPSVQHLQGEGDLNSRFVETKAAYREPRIKTYGFQRITELSLFEVSGPLSAMSDLGLSLFLLGEEGVGFHLVFSRASTSRFALSLLISPQAEKAVAGRLISLIPVDELMYCVSPAELVFFQGPHFSDRYGIFHAAAQALSDRGLSMLACTCSGSCIYIVLPIGKSEEAVQALTDAFDIPWRRRSRRQGDTG